MGFWLYLFRILPPLRQSPSFPSFSHVMGVRGDVLGISARFQKTLH